MDLSNKKDILIYLSEAEDFLEDLKDCFSPEQISQFVNYSRDVDKNSCIDILNDLYDWLKVEIHNADTILTIAWDSSECGPGGNVFFRYNCKYGLVMMSSSDYADDHVEFFNRDRFRPWGIENLKNDYIDFESTTYSEKDLIAISAYLGLGESTKLTINGRKM